MELLTNQAFEDATPRVVLAKLHAIRKEGNRAAHGENVDVPTSLWLLKEAFDLACWLHLTHGGGPRTDFPAYTPPPEIEGSANPAVLQREKKAVLERLAAQEAAHAAVVDRPGGSPCRRPGSRSRRRPGAGHSGAGPGCGTPGR